MKKRRAAIIGCGMICNSAHFPALDILKDTTLDYTNHKRRILYLMRNYKYTDDEPLVLSK